MTQITPPSFEWDTKNATLSFIGDWSVLTISDIRERFLSCVQNATQSFCVDGSQLHRLDSAGALLIEQGLKASINNALTVDFKGFNPEQTALLQLIHDNQDAVSTAPLKPKPNGFFYQVGREFFVKLRQLDGLVLLIGELSGRFFYAFSQWKRFHVPSIVSNIFSTGIQALPILALLSFLIGVVLAYQMGAQLSVYGANIYVAVICGIAIFREFGPLITAIIVAGRTSSAFTAQLGSMTVNEEVDALKTMGLSPVEMLVIPKVIGLTLIFPLLIFWADIFALGGAMVMSKFMLDVSYTDFLQHVKSSVGLKHYMLGLYKAPVFAILIALVGCFQGFQVESNSDSIGKQTTKSVVQALFLIIVADALFSILYSLLGL